MKLYNDNGNTIFEGSIEELQAIATAMGMDVPSYIASLKKSVAPSTATVNGKGTATRKILTEEEREAKKKERAEKRKEEQKAWFNSLTETEQQAFIAKKEEKRRAATYMQAITASKLNVAKIIEKKYGGKRIETAEYHKLFKAEMKKYGFDWSPKTK